MRYLSLGRLLGGCGILWALCLPVVTWAGSLPPTSGGTPGTSDIPSPQTFLYTLDGGSSTVTGSLGSIGFTNATWRFTALGSTADVTTGTFGEQNQPYYFLPTTVTLLLTEGQTTLRATLDQPTGTQWGIMSIDLDDTELSDLQAAGFVLLGGQTADPPGAGLANSTGNGDPGLYNSLMAPGIWNGGDPAFFADSHLINTSLGQLVLTSINDVINTGSFSITPATVPEPTSLGLAVLAAGGVAMLRRSRNRRPLGSSA